MCAYTIYWFLIGKQQRNYTWNKKKRKRWTQVSMYASEGLHTIQFFFKTSLVRVVCVCVLAPLLPVCVRVKETETEKETGEARDVLSTSHEHPLTHISLTPSWLWGQENTGRCWDPPILCDILNATGHRSPGNEKSASHVEMKVLRSQVCGQWTACGGCSE